MFFVSFFAVLDPQRMKIGSLNLTQSVGKVNSFSPIIHFFARMSCKSVSLWFVRVGCGCFCVKKEAEAASVGCAFIVPLLIKDYELAVGGAEGVLFIYDCVDLMHRIWLLCKFNKKSVSLSCTLPKSGAVFSIQNTPQRLLFESVGVII